MILSPKTILFVCSQGRIRSRTAEVLAIRGGMDARSCGTDADAMVPINDHLIREADLIVCMEEHHAATVREFMHAEGKSIHVLGIEDIYEPFTPRLVAVLTAKIGVLLPDVARAMKAELEARHGETKPVRRNSKRI